MVSGGMPTPNSTHAEDVLEFAIALFQALEYYNETHKSNLRIRVGKFFALLFLLFVPRNEYRPCCCWSDWKKEMGLWFMVF